MSACQACKWGSYTHAARVQSSFTVQANQPPSNVYQLCLRLHYQLCAQSSTTVATKSNKKKIWSLPPESLHRTPSNTALRHHSRHASRGHTTCMRAWQHNQYCPQHVQHSPAAICRLRSDDHCCLDLKAGTALTCSAMVANTVWLPARTHTCTHTGWFRTHPQPH